MYKLFVNVKIYGWSILSCSIFRGICSNDDTVKRLMKPLIEPMANSYLKIFKQASNHREFFGLRDFYSLIKMVFSFVEKSKQPPTWFEMLHAIKRNFGGLEDIDPETRFRKALTGKININDQVWCHIHLFSLCQLWNSSDPCVLEISCFGSL